MKKNSSDINVWKKKMIKKWKELVSLYNQAQSDPKVKILIKILWGLLKILLKIIISHFLGY